MGKPHLVFSLVVGTLWPMYLGAQSASRQLGINWQPVWSHRGEKGTTARESRERDRDDSSSAVEDPKDREYNQLSSSADAALSRKDYQEALRLDRLKRSLRDGLCTGREDCFL